MADLLADILPDVAPQEPEPRQPPAVVKSSKLALRRGNRLVAVREDREEGKPQQFGYLARPFILCGLPFKRPAKGISYYKRQTRAPR